MPLNLSVFLFQYIFPKYMFFFFSDLAFFFPTIMYNSYTKHRY